MSKLLLDEHPLQVMPTLAVLIGLNEAIILQQVHYWLQNKEQANRDCIDGGYWVYNTYGQWKVQFPFWSIMTIRRAITKLENCGLLVSANYNKAGFDKTKWYTIDYAALSNLDSPSVQNEHIVYSACTNASGQNEQTNTRDYLPETTTKISGLEYSTHSLKKEMSLPSDSEQYSFSLDIFKRQIKTCYQRLNKDIVLSLDEVCGIVDYFMERYSRYITIEHPRLGNEAVTGILENISGCCHSDGAEWDMDVESYKECIDFYFTQNFKGNEQGRCDYSLAHFILSDDIRANCLYKTCY